MRALILIAAALVTSALLSFTAHAATLDVMGGQLVGASGVDVGGSLYDVAFEDGTCIDLFSGCDSASDFTFSDEASALLASQALLDQVFLDSGSGSFDTDPSLTAGCTDLDECLAVTLHAIPDAFGGGAAAANRAPGSGVDETLAGIGGAPAADTSGIANVVYAVWTPVPEPSTVLLLAGGVLAWAIRRTCRPAC